MPNCKAFASGVGLEEQLRSGQMRPPKNPLSLPIKSIAWKFSRFSPKNEVAILYFIEAVLPHHDRVHRG